MLVLVVLQSVVVNKPGSLARGVVLVQVGFLELGNQVVVAFDASPCMNKHIELGRSP